MKHLRKPAALLAACLLFAAAGCAPPETEQTSVAMGRYVEEEFPLPDEISQLRYIGMDAAGDFVLLGVAGNSDGLSVWRSADGGGTWSAETPSWLEQIQQYDLNVFTLDEQGKPWFTDEPEDPALEALYASGDDDALDAYIPPVAPLYAIRDGNPEQQAAQLQNSRGNNAQELVVRDGYLAVSYGDLAVYDARTGDKILEVDTGGYLQAGDFLLDDGALVVVDGSTALLYDLETGRQSGELPLQGASQYQPTDFFDFGEKRTVIAATGEAGVYAYCNDGGIYRVSADGLIHEKLLAGELSSLMLPGVAVQQMFVWDDSYYVYVTDRASLPWQLSGAALLRHRYDETVPAAPTTELRVYSLYETASIRQAAGVFQRDNQHVQVRYEVAMDGSGGLTEQDALRALSTELLAGKGPDILVLDGMPVDRYREKGVLMELSGVLSGEIQEQVLPNLLEALGDDGAFYAVPTRFALPMVLADGDTIAAAGDLSGLTALAASLDSPQLGALPSDLLELLVAVYSGGWFHEDGTLDPAAASQGIGDLGKLLALYDDVDHEGLWNTMGDARAGAIGWVDGWTPFYLTQLTAIEQLTGPYTAEEQYGAVYAPYPSAAEASITLRTVIGVNNATDQPELAGAFVERLLSQPLQTLELGDGMPVNRLALEKKQVNPSDSNESRFGISFYDEFQNGAEKGLTIPLTWPDQQYFDDFLATVASIRSYYLPDATLLGILEDETAPFFRGERSLEDTVQALKKKADLYAAE